MPETKTPRAQGPAEKPPGQLLQFPARIKPPEPLTPQQAAIADLSGEQDELRDLENRIHVTLASLELAADAPEEQQRIRRIFRQTLLKFRDLQLVLDLARPTEDAED